MIVIALIATAILTVGSIPDSKYSMGKREKSKLFRNSKGYFSASRYWLWTIGIITGGWLLLLIFSDQFPSYRTIYYLTYTVVTSIIGIKRYLQGQKSKRLYHSMTNIVSYIG